MKRGISSSSAVVRAIVLVAALTSHVSAFSAPHHTQSVNTWSQVSPVFGKIPFVHNVETTKLEMKSFSFGDKDQGTVKRNVHSKRRKALKILCRTAVSLSILALATSSIAPPPSLAAQAVAESAPVVEHLHVGQKVANYFRSFGLPDLAILAIISALPVIELRGAVPVGVWMGLPILQVLPVCVAGNMVPIIPLMFLLRNNTLK